MAEEITVEQALEELDKFSEEWVDKDLEKGIAVPFRHWRNGHHKELLSVIFWKNMIVPFIFTIFVFTCAKTEAWKLFAILFPCYIIYWIAFIWIKKREDASFILKTDGMTIVTPKDKIFFPWESIKSIASTKGETVESHSKTGYHRFETVYATGYNLVIKVGDKYYIFYEVYSKTQVVDPSGQINYALMPLHIAYKALIAAQRKVKNS